MEVDITLILKVILIAFINWALVPFALKALVERKHVLGGKKAPWAVAIIFLTCAGSLLYLIFHPNFGVETETRTEIV
jgi:hypothetical protein